MKYFRFLPLLLLIQGHLFAEAEPLIPTQSYMAQMGNMLISLILLLGVAFGILLILKKISKKRAFYLNQSTAIKILERRVLHAKASLYLVEILGKGVVISESQGNIQLITELPEGTDLNIHEREEEPTYIKSSIQKKIFQLFKAKNL